MRSNLPVTGREHEMADGTTLMSATDTESRLVYANDAFVQTSGFDPRELIGEPHNVVRHPDMPPAAFADLWETLRAGRSWSALVKNRRKDGDHYWVRANVAPMCAGGTTIGYMSVRTKPRHDEIEAAERLYRAMREKRARGIRLRHGVVLRTGAASLLTLFKTLSARGRVALGCLAGAVLPTVAVAAAGAGRGVTAFAAAGALVGAAVAWTIVDGLLTRPLKAVAEHAQHVANGDADGRLGLDRIDEIGLLARNVDQTGLRLRTFVGDVAQRMAGVEAGTSEIATANRDHSARTERAAASLQQTAASMDQINATVRNNADTSRRSASLVEDAARAAREGAAVMNEVVRGMGEIAQSSRRIAEITGVIDSIAFQSNILALNAAVEAARAGEEGRGFGVVAAEVRTLASRSATAAKEIRGLIDEASTRVHTGSDQVGRAGASMQSIVEHIDQVTGMIESIEVATTEQTHGITQINQAVADLDRVTQENAAMVEQAAAASTAVSEQAALLNQSIQVFRQA